MKISKTILTIILFFISLSAFAKENKFSNSFSIQLGLNGVGRDTNSYDLAFIPPDLAYSHEIFDNDKVNISTATFYDNIGVKINDTNFSYRVGQRFDFGLELGKYTPYLTLGFGVIRNSHHFQTSPVYGTGILYRFAKRFLFVNEINFQDVIYQTHSYSIINASTGIVYAF